MPTTDYSAHSVHDLLNATLGIHAELRHRGLIRTGTSLAGELMERVVSDAYHAALSAPAAAGWDATTADGTRIQVKTRFLPPEVHRAFTFRNLDFDVAVLVRLDSTTFNLDWAREVPRDELERIVTPHATAGYRLSLARATAYGKDVTALLSATFARLH